jgi:hypothetical protein
MILAILLVNLLLISHDAAAITPLKSLIFGDLTNRYIEKIQDPLDYIFRIQTVEQVKSLSTVRSELALYRGFLEEGVSLDNFCKAEPSIEYSSIRNKNLATRSLLTNLQYIGLDLTSRALGKYSQYFDFTVEDHKNMIDGLVGNYCSQNISVISVNAIKDNLYLKFEKDNLFVLPSVKENKLFPTKFHSIISEENARKNELFRTIELFKSFCSWGGDVKNLRLLVPLVRNAQVMSFMIRQMASQKLEWNEFKRGFKLQLYKDTSKILCQGLVCRKADDYEFNNKFPRGIGSKSVDDDLKRIYCENLRDTDYVLKDQAPKIKKIIKSRTFDDDNLLTSQFITLITNVPDLFVRSEKFTDSKEFMRASMDSSWDEWAKNQGKSFENELLYEESLTLELVNRKYYYSRDDPNINVVFDVNLGEFDRVFQIKGKIKTKFYINLSTEMLSWIRRSILFSDPKKPETKKQVYKRVEQSVVDAVELAKYRYKIPPWKIGLEKLVAKEIIFQVTNLRDDPYITTDKRMIRIPIEFNYGIFALKYIHSKYLVNKNKKRIQENLKKFQQDQDQDQDQDQAQFKVTKGQN